MESAASPRRQPAQPTLPQLVLEGVGPAAILQGLVPVLEGQAVRADQAVPAPAVVLAAREAQALAGAARGVSSTTLQAP